MLQGRKITEEMGAILQERQDILTQLTQERSLAQEDRELWRQKGTRTGRIAGEAVYPVKTPVAGVVTYSLPADGEV